MSNQQQLGESGEDATRVVTERGLVVFGAAGLGLVCDLIACNSTA